MIFDNLFTVLRNSYKNFHARGLDYICLKRSPELTLKLYLIDGGADIDNLPDVVNPHDHRYRFKTTVLSGAMENVLYIPTAYGKVYQEFEWRTPLNGGGGFTWKQERRLTEYSRSRIDPGQHYELDHLGIHTIRCARQTVLLLEQYADDLPLIIPTSTFTQSKEPPSLDGLYEKFTAQELVDRLGGITFPSSGQRVVDGIPWI